MKRSTWSFVILFFLAGLASAQRANSAKTLAESQKAWPTFWTSFSQAVKKDNLLSFQEFVSKEFDASGLYRGKERCKHLSDGRQEFVCVLRGQVSGPMNELDWIFRAQTKTKKIAVENGQIRRTVDRWNDTYRFAEFAFESDEKWRLIRLGSGGA